MPKVNDISRQAGQEEPMNKNAEEKRVTKLGCKSMKNNFEVLVSHTPNRQEWGLEI